MSTGCSKPSSEDQLSWSKHTHEYVHHLEYCVQVDDKELAELEKDLQLANHMLRLAFGVGPKRDKDGTYKSACELVILAYKKYLELEIQLEIEARSEC